MIVWDPIAPTEVLLSGINWAPRLGTDTILTSVWSASTPSGLTIAPNIPGWVANTSLVWISNATLGVVYHITNTITTVAGGTEVETVQVCCAPK
jgi:hypothetical protein